MVDRHYPWNEVFQLRLLTFLVQDPEKIADLMEPQFFTGNPVLVEISRILKDAYAAHGKQSRVSRSTFTELVRATMGKSDAWSLYKKTIRKLYKTELTDKSILYKQALEFAKESRYRETLIAAEKDVNNRNYQRVHERVEKLRTLLNETGAGTSPAPLVPKDFQTPHRLHTVKD